MTLNNIVFVFMFKSNCVIQNALRVIMVSSVEFFLCLRSKQRSSQGLGPSLHLLHTLWFTLQQGKPNGRASDSSDSGDVLNGEGKREIPLPPTLRQECVLVCWTFLEQFRYFEIWLYFLPSFLPSFSFSSFCAFLFSFFLFYFMLFFL